MPIRVATLPCPVCRALVRVRAADPTVAPYVALTLDAATCDCELSDEDVQAIERLGFGAPWCHA